MARLVVVLAVAVAATAGAVTGGLGQRAASAATSYRVTGLQMVTTQTALSTATSRTASVRCPEGKQVLGGGASILEANSNVVLTTLRPSGNGDLRDSYTAGASTAYTDPTSSAEDWRLGVYAFCADPVPGWHIVQATTASSSTEKQATAAVCPSGQKVLGTGAMVRFHSDGNGTVYNHGIGLQVARADGVGGIARAQAREVPEGYGYPWQVTAYAVCADPPQAYQVVYNDSDDTGTRARDGNVYGTYAWVEGCPSWFPPGSFTPRRLQRVGMGGAVEDTAPGNVALYELEPAFFEPAETFVEARETTPVYGASWSVAAQDICVS